MTEKSGKNVSKKPADAGVLGSLPSTRPARIGGDRRTATRTKARAETTTTGARAKPRSRVTATRPAAPRTKAADARTAPPPEPEPRRAPGPPRGTELVGTAVQAAGELAQIGLTVGSQILRRAASRFPRP
jgi:hypothetical protein